MTAKEKLYNLWYMPQAIEVYSRTERNKQLTTITSSVAETTIITARTNYFRDLISLIISNTSGTACNVTIKDATGGSTVAVIAVPAGEVRGFVLPGTVSIPQAAAGNNWTATCSASVASINITAVFGDVKST